MISIIVPIYNAAQYLTDCINSIIAQTTAEPLEIILIDDASTDGSLQIARQYAKKHAEDPRRKVILLTQQHSGQSIARNLGMEKSTGEFIAFVDADDCIAPDWCDRHLAAIKGVDYVQSGYRRTSDTEEKGWRVGIRQLPEHKYRYTSPCMRLYRRSALHNIRFEGGMIYEDVVFSSDLWLSGATCRRIRYAGYLYTKNPESTTSRVHLEAQKRVLDELHNRLPNASWKGRFILWLTIIRLQLYFIMEMRKDVICALADKKKTVASLAALLLSAFSIQFSALNAATYFASPDGTGDGKSQNAPTTFAKGIKLLQIPGDTLYLFSGQYDLLTTDINNLVGTSEKRIVIAGYEGINRSGKYPTILDFRKTEYGKRGLQIKNTCAFLHIKNLTLRYSGKNNLICYASNNIFENLDVYGSADTGFQIREGGNNIVKNVDSHDNFDYQTTSGTTANFGGNADGFADKQFTGAGNHYIGCRAWNNSDDGWDFFQRYSSSNTIIENCICYQNGQPYYNLTNNPRVETDKNWFDSKVGTQMTDRYGNTVTITLEKYPCQGNGNGFKMGGGDTEKGGCQHNLLIHHCLSVANNARGFDQNNNGGKMYIYNCTAYDNYPNYGFTTAFGTNTLQNNISFQSKKSDSYKSQTVAANDHNTWNSGFSCSAADFLSLDTTQLLAPRKSDGNLPDGSCMHLQENSKLIDTGIDVNLGYNGLAPDLGCFEAPGEEHKPDPEEPTQTEQPEGTHAIAFVSLPNASEDKALLGFLRNNKSLWVNVTDATDASVDYNRYEIIVVSSKPNSSVAGFNVLKGYDKPMVVLKPFLFKPGVWSWGTAINTSDLEISISQPEHPLFRGLTITEGELPLFSSCNQNAVTGISEWTNMTFIDPQSESTYHLASPISQPSYTTIADLPAGTNCNGTILPKRLVMIGVSEYSTTFLTDEGKKVIENAILYLLGNNGEQGINNNITQVNNHKFIHNGKLFLQTGSTVFDATGNCIKR